MRIRTKFFLILFLTLLVSELYQVLVIQAKKALISEKTAGMSPSNKRKVAAFFESKSYADTKSDIEDYCEMINERAETMRRNDVSVISERTRPMHRHVISHIDDTTDDFVNEKFSKHNDDSDDSDEFLETASRFV